MSLDYNRPRRPNPETLSYLRSLPLEENACDEEIKKYMDFHVREKDKKKDAETVDNSSRGSIVLNDDNDDDDIGEPEYPRVLSAAISAIEEIKNEVASLAGDEYGSECIEILTRVGAKYSITAAKRLLEGVAGYHLHLATHRYGSHVVQTILQFAVHGPNSKSDSDDDENNYSESQIVSALELEDDDVVGDTNDNMHTLSLQDLILNIVEELLPFVSELAVHVCGSHVLRTLLCVLAGLELSSTSKPVLSKGNSTLRGKPKGNKKKKKKKKYPNDHDPSTSKNNNNNVGIIELKRLRNQRIDTNDPKVRNALNSLINALSLGTLDNYSKDITFPPGELQQLSCHPSAGPLLIVLLKVLIEVDQMHTTVPSKLTRRDFDNKAIVDFRLGIHPPQPQFQSGSRAETFAKLIICWDDKLSSKDQKYAGDVVYGMSGESRGSHMLETLLRTAHDDLFYDICTAGGLFNPSALKEYIQHDVSNFVVQTLLSTVRSKKQAEKLLECLEPCLQNGYLIHSINRRRGILWKATEMSAKFRVGQEQLLKNIQVGFSTSIDNWKENKSNEGDNSDGNIPKIPIPTIEECVPKLLEIKHPENDNSRIGLDVAGTRTIYHLLRFTPRLCGNVLKGILTKLSQQELEWIANDGLGSRCIMDGMLEGNISDKQFSNAVRTLLEKMSGRWVALSVERVGHHTVRKVFASLKSLNDKAVLSAELASGINKLNGTAMGRSIISSCFVKDFLEGEAVWSEAVKKQFEKDSFIREFIEKNDGNCDEEKPIRKKRKRKKKTFDRGYNGEDGMSTDDITKEKKKR